MTKLLRISLALTLIVIGSQTAFGMDDVAFAELDAFWAEVSRTVEEGDFEGYAATYHRDAILVSGLSETTYPISQALEGWRQGFEDAKAGKIEPSVEFRFTQRLSDATTAHETGIFHYAVVDADGQLTDQFIHFEALLLLNQEWKMMMEYQKSLASKEEWDAAK